VVLWGGGGEGDLFIGNTIFAEIRLGPLVHHCQGLPHVKFLQGIKLPYEESDDGQRYDEVVRVWAMHLGYCI